MWTCRYCGKKFDPFDGCITDGSKHFCSTECYDAYITDKASKGMVKKIKVEEDKEYYKKIIDYIVNRNPNINLGMVGQQIKQQLTEFDINYRQLWAAIVYAEKFENHPFDCKYGMRQYDIYIIPSIKYKAQVDKVKANKNKLIEEEKANGYVKIVRPFFLDEEENLDE